MLSERLHPGSRTSKTYNHTARTPNRHNLCVLPTGPSSPRLEVRTDIHLRRALGLQLLEHLLLLDVLHAPFFEVRDLQLLSALRFPYPLPFTIFSALP